MTATFEQKAIDLIGTPYRHNGRDLSGLDGLGLVSLVTGVPVPASSMPNWNERRPCPEPVLNFARANWRELQGFATVSTERLPEPPPVGSIVLFRVVSTKPADHFSVMVSQDCFVEAMAGRGVVKTWLSRFWRERVVAVFSPAHMKEAA